MTAADLAQHIAAGDLAPMPPWRVVGLEAGIDLDDVLAEARDLGDAA